MLTQDDLPPELATAKISFDNPVGSFNPSSLTVNAAPTERASFPWRTCGTRPAKTIKRSGKNGPRLYQPLSERRRRDHADTRPTDEERLGTGLPCDTWCNTNTCPRAERPWFRAIVVGAVGDVGEPSYARGTSRA